MTDYVKKTLDLLADSDPIQVLEASPMSLELYLHSFSEDDLARSYAANKWSASEIMAHLADMEIVFGFRIRQVTSQDYHQVQFVDETAWASRYARFDASQAVDAFRALRTWNMALLSSFTLQDWLKDTEHPERGKESIDLLIRLWAGHDLNHLAQLRHISET